MQRAKRVKYITPIDSMQNEVIGIIKKKKDDKVKEILHSAVVVNRSLEKGTVIYVHPCGRYYTVEFCFGDAKIRESYTVRSDVNPIKFMR